MKKKIVLFTTFFALKAQLFEEENRANKYKLIANYINPDAVKSEKTQEGMYRVVFLTNKGNLYPICLEYKDLLERPLLRVLIEHQRYPIHINFFKEFCPNRVRSYLQWCFQDVNNKEHNSYKELIALFDMRRCVNKVLQRCINTDSFY